MDGNRDSSLSSPIGHLPVFAFNREHLDLWRCCVTFGRVRDATTGFERRFSRCLELTSRKENFLSPMLLLLLCGCVIRRKLFIMFVN